MILCSCVLPTRGNPEGVARLYYSFLSLFDLGRIELILRIDDDDVDGYKPLLEQYPEIRVIPGPRESGYESLNHFYEALARASLGKWIWFLDDDVYFEGPNVTEVLERVPTDGTFIRPQHYQLNESMYQNCAYGPFPMVPNKFWEQFSDFNFPQPIDDHIHSFLMSKGWVIRYLPNVTAVHDRSRDKFPLPRPACNERH